MRLSFRHLPSSLLPGTSKVATNASSQSAPMEAQASRDRVVSPSRTSLPENSQRAKALNKLHSRPTHLNALLAQPDSPDFISAPENHSSDPNHASTSTNVPRSRTPLGEDWAQAEVFEELQGERQKQYNDTLQAVHKDEAELLALLNTVQKTGRLVRIQKPQQTFPVLKKMWSSFVRSTPVSETQLYSKLEQLKTASDRLVSQRARDFHAEQERIQTLATAIENTVKINNLKAQIKSESLEIMHLGEGNLSAVKEKLALLHSHPNSQALADRLEKKYFNPALKRAVVSLKKAPNFSDMPYASFRLQFRQEQQKSDLASVNQQIKPSKVKGLTSMRGPHIIDLPDNAWHAVCEGRKLKKHYDSIINEISQALSQDPEAATSYLNNADSALHALQAEGFRQSYHVGWRIDQQDFLKAKKYIVANANAHIVDARKILATQKSFLDALQKVKEAGRFEYDPLIKAAMHQHGQEGLQAYLYKTVLANSTPNEFANNSAITTPASNKPQIRERDLYRKWTDLQRAGLSRIADKGDFTKRLQHLSNDLADTLAVRRAMSELRSKLIPIQKTGDGDFSGIEESLALIERFPDKGSVSLPLEATFHTSRAFSSVMHSIQQRAEHLRTMNEVSTFSEDGQRTGQETPIILNTNEPLHALVKNQVDQMTEHGMLFPDSSINALANLGLKMGAWEILTPTEELPPQALDAHLLRSSSTSEKSQGSPS